jgi:hypothetical protein
MHGIILDEGLIVDRVWRNDLTSTQTSICRASQSKIFAVIMGTIKLIGRTAASRNGSERLSPIESLISAIPMLSLKDSTKMALGESLATTSLALIAARYGAALSDGFSG